MSREVIERVVDNPERALPRATDWFSAQGYEVASRSAAEAHLVHRGRHERLSIRSSAGRLRFEFSPTIPGGALAARTDLERRVDEATGTSAAAGGGAPRRCTVCAAVAPEGANACPVCGGSLS
ncbi:MAG: hypothetical protein AB1938_28905 [Myxococcota bacterium]